MNRLSNSHPGSGLYQLFCGRSEGASIRRHTGNVFSRLVRFPWENLITRGRFDAVYLLGVFDNRGPVIDLEGDGSCLKASDADRICSPFAIASSTGINPDLGTEQDFKELLESIHTHGAKAITDFVPGHTGVTHPWTRSNPEYYVRDESNALKRIHSGDVFELNYACRGLRLAQTTVLKRMAAMGIDGVRCDLAHRVPVDFWEQAIGEVRSRYPNFGFIAEAYGKNAFDWSPIEALLSAGFDAAYDATFRKNALAVSRGGTISDFVAHLEFVARSPFGHRLVHFLANHDDPMPESVLPLQEALLALAFVLPGTSLIYNGQLNGLTRRLKHHTIDLLPESLSEFTSIPEWFTTLAGFRQRFCPLLKSAFTSQGLVYAALETSFGLGTLVANLSPREQPFTVRQKEGGRGLLRGLSCHSVLPSGQADFFELP